MRRYAQTYPDLILQARRKGLPLEKLVELRKGYEYAEALFDGIYRGEHVPFICHAVRTASILLEEDLPVEVVNAMQLHAAYSLGCFEDRKRGRPTPEHRAAVRATVGPQAESLIYDYDHNPWYGAEHIRKHLENVSRYGDREKWLVLMRVANEIDDYAELGMVFREGEEYRKFIREYGADAVELSRRLGHPILAEELKQVFEETMTTTLPAELVVGLVEFGECYMQPLRKLLEKSFLERFAIKLKKIFSR